SSGFVLIAATGARRSATAWPRLTTRTYSPQVLGSSSVDDTETILAGLRAMPDVAAAAAFAWMPASPVGLKPEQGLFAGLGDGFGQTVLRPIIERGRRADPRRADEVTINDVMAKFAHLTVGSRTHLVGPSIEQDASVVAIALPVLGAVVIGVAASPVIAAVASPAVRVGLARIADPARHAWFDGRVLVLGAVAMGVALGAVTLLAGWRLAALVGRSRPERSVRPSRLARVAGGSSAAIVGLASAGG